MAKEGEGGALKAAGPTTAATAAGAATASRVGMSRGGGVAAAVELAEAVAAEVEDGPGCYNTLTCPYLRQAPRLPSQDLPTVSD